VGVTRNAGIRGQLLRVYGGNQKTEDAVMRALRWLKKNQLPDGSWANTKPAMTGLAILTFLAHGEIPSANNPEFGETVRRGLEFLISIQQPSGRFAGSDGHEYSMPIATYALCEAYGMTMNPNVKEAADRARAEQEAALLRVLAEATDLYRARRYDEAAAILRSRAIRNMAERTSCCNSAYCCWSTEIWLLRE